MKPELPGLLYSKLACFSVDEARHEVASQAASTPLLPHHGGPMAYQE
jgi:hypothetical protein